MRSRCARGVDQGTKWGPVQPSYRVNKGADGVSDGGLRELGCVGQKRPIPWS